MRLGPEWKQLPMSEAELRVLPDTFEYLGEDPELQHLVGKSFKTRDAEALVHIGEREYIWVEDAKGNRWRPWYDRYLWREDESPPPAPDPPPVYGPRAMSTADLGALGLTDAQLSDLAKTIGKVWAPDRPGPSDARRAMFDEVMAHEYAEGADR